MRNLSHKWSFYKSPCKEPLTKEEVLYWKSMLRRILKVGIEFEFNLPSENPNKCRAINPLCRCVSAKSNCWKECALSKLCQLPECPGMNCIHFISACASCVEHTFPCSKCDIRFDPKTSPQHIRKHLERKLSPGLSYGSISSTGVHRIARDGSLLGEKGAEVITTGRRVDYWEFYKMSKKIIDEVVSAGGYLNERCSTHMHVLASYYHNIAKPEHELGGNISEMERPMPEIIAANLHQLVRRYQNAITWMTMALSDPHALTRWEKFRVSVLEISALVLPMQQVSVEVYEHSDNNKYGWINYSNSLFSTGDGTILRFHVEFRAADGMLSPSAVAALACMYYALVIKAVEISRYGVVEVGDRAWLKKAIEIKRAILNNRKDYKEGDRFGDTSGIKPYIDILIGESMDLVLQLKAILTRVGPAFEVLERLAEKPIALRRCEGQSWEQIERDLEVKMEKEDHIDVALTEMITLNQIKECNSMQEWIHIVSEILAKDKDIRTVGINIRQQIDKFVNNKIDNGQLVWSNKIGSPILL